MCLETFDLHKQKLNLNTDFTLKKKKKTNSKWIPDLKENLESINLLEDNIGENLKFGDVWDTAPKTQFIKEMID